MLLLVKLVMLSHLKTAVAEVRRVAFFDLLLLLLGFLAVPQRRRLRNTLKGVRDEVLLIERG